MPIVRVSCKDPDSQHLRRVFSLIKAQNMLQNDNQKKQNLNDQLSQIDISDYLKILEQDKSEISKQAQGQNKEIQIQTQKQLNQFKNLKEVNEKLFYTPVNINSSSQSSRSQLFTNKYLKHRSQVIDPLSLQNINQSERRESVILSRTNRNSQQQKMFSQHRLQSGSLRYSSRFARSEQVSPRNDDISDGDPEKFRTACLRQSQNPMTQAFNNDLNQSQNIKCLNEQYKLQYDKDSFLRFYKFKQSLQSQNILFNQLQQYQKSNNRNLTQKNAVENNQDFFVTINSVQTELLIKHTNLGCSLTALNKQLYIIGGKTTTFLRKGFSVAKQSEFDEQMQFEERQDVYVEKELAYNDIYNRYGHSSIAFQGQIVIISGESGTLKGNNNMRTVLADIVFLDPSTMQRQIISFDKPLDKLRAFGTCILGKYLYQYGGIRESGEISNQLIRIKLTQNRDKNFKWKAIKCSIKAPLRAYSQICVIFYEHKLKIKEGQIQKFKLKSLSQEIDWENAQNYIEKEGLYIFGGLDENSKPTNDLFIIEIDENSRHSLISQTTKGIKPQPRCMHSLNYYSQSNVLILFGGRNDTLHNQHILSDMHVLCLDSLTWIEVTYCSQKLSPRFNFCTQIIDTKLIILGGQNEQYKLMHDYVVVEMDQKVNFNNHASKYLFKKMGAFIRANFSKNKKPIIQQQQIEETVETVCLRNDIKKIQKTNNQKLLISS